MLPQDGWDGTPVGTLLPEVWELAAMCGMPLTRPTDDEVKQLFDLWGNQREFEKNMPQIAAALKLDGREVPDEQVLNLLEATETLNRIAFRRVKGTDTPTNVGPVIVLFNGATVPWMERRLAELDRQAESGLQVVYLIALVDSNRVCQLETEVINPRVMAYHQKHGHYPTEEDMMESVLQNSLSGLPYNIISSTGGLEGNVAAFATQYFEMEAVDIYVPTNANATYVPLAVRRVLRQSWPRFDVRRDQFWFSQDGFPLARTPEQAADPANYQRPMTVFSGLVRLVSELHKLNR